MKRILIAGILGVAELSRAGISDSQAVAAIIGEGGQTLRTQTLIACVIRNRGSLRGVYGASNPVVARASTKVKATALAAWQASARADLTHGLKFFGCAGDATYFRHIGLHPAMVSGAITFWK
jgi:hypothetical protein